MKRFEKWLVGKGRYWAMWLAVLLALFGEWRGFAVVGLCLVLSRMAEIKAELIAARFKDRRF